MRRMWIALAVTFLSLPTAAQDGDQPKRGVFGDGQAVRHFERPRPYDVQHYRIAVDVDPVARHVSGDVTITLRPLHPNLKRVDLDFGDLKVQQVQSNRGTGRFEHADGRLRVPLTRPAGPADTVTVRVTYAGSPRMGMYFVNPDSGFPDKPVMAWTQGEPELARGWFPCWDKPNDFATFDLLYTVPAGFTAVGNGALQQVQKQGGKWTWHWKSAVPHVPYLVTLVAGKLQRFEEKAGDLLLEHYLPAGWPDAAGCADRCFGKTAAMVGFMQEHFGVPYPYAKYAQVCVKDFLWGGMENASATTLTTGTLHDARAHLDWQSDGLVIHELAHQWFGDLVTCRDWAHIWLNEGFATYSESLWVRHEKGATAYRAHMRESTGWYTWEDGAKYRRPVVCHHYADSQDLFDGHTYSKGARILYMLHALVGEEAWRAGCKAYLETHRGQPVETADLRRAMETASGRDLAWFFDQWVHAPGLPELVVSWSYDPGTQSVVLTVKQTQDTADGTPLFHLPCTVVIVDDEGPTEHPILAQGRESRFVLPARSWPHHLRFDKHDILVKQLTFERPVAQLASQLRRSPDDVCGRLDAVEALGADAAVKEAGGRDLAVAALREALGADEFHGVRSAAASALAAYGEDAVQPLLDALGDADSRVRRAAATALGAAAGGASVTVTGRLEALAKSDKSYRVQADAVAALAALQASGARAMALWAMEQDSHREVVRSAGLRALFTLKHPLAIERAMNATAYGTDTRLVGTAIELLAEHGKDHPAVVERIAALCTDPFIWTRNNAIEALGKIGTVDHLAVLRERQEAEVDGRPRQAAREAIAAIEARDRASAEDPAKAKVRALEAKAREAELRAELAAREAEIAALKAEKARLEADLAAAKEAAKEAAGAGK